jgi:hypothetical protein
VTGVNKWGALIHFGRRESKQACPTHTLLPRSIRLLLALLVIIPRWKWPHLFITVLVFWPRLRRVRRHGLVPRALACVFFRHGWAVSGVGWATVQLFAFLLLSVIIDTVLLRMMVVLVLGGFSVASAASINLFHMSRKSDLL